MNNKSDMRKGSSVVIIGNNNNITFNVNDNN